MKKKEIVTSIKRGKDREKIYNKVEKRLLNVFSQSNFEFDITDTTNICKFVSIANNFIYATTTTFFEYAFKCSIFYYCDICIKYWLDNVKPTSKANINFIELLSSIAQPPYNEIIREPVFVCYENERKFDTNNIYEKKCIVEIIKKNNENCEISEPSMAHPMTEDEYDNIQAGNEVIIQIEQYDAFLLSSEVMTNYNLKQFLTDGSFRQSHISLKDLFPTNVNRKGCNGIHFIDINSKVNQPLSFYNFNKFATYLIYQRIPDFQGFTLGKLHTVFKTLNYVAPDISDNQIIWYFQFHTDSFVYETKFKLKYDSNLPKHEPTFMEVTLSKCGEEDPIDVFKFHILLFITSLVNNAHSIINNNLNDEYIHEVERIVRKGTFKDKLVSEDACFAEVLYGGNTIITSNNIIKLDNSTGLINKIKFKEKLDQHSREISMLDKSYALRNIQIGLFSIPVTHIGLNKIRLSNGKRPKKFKDITEKTISKFAEKVFSIFFLIDNVEMKEIEAKKTTNVTTLEELESILYPLIDQKKLDSFHDVINSVDMTLKNNFLNNMRKHDLSKYKFSFQQLCMCIFNKKKCMELMDCSSWLDKWIQFLQKPTTTKIPTLEMFEVNINKLPVDIYIQKKIKEKMNVDKMQITPLVLCILTLSPSQWKQINKEQRLQIYNHGKMIFLSEYGYYPMHFVLHFCSTFENRYFYVKMLFMKELGIDESDLSMKIIISPYDLCAILLKWCNNNDTDTFLQALMEWPFSKLTQIFYLLSIKMRPDLLKKRFWVQSLKDIYTFLPGCGMVEHKMKEYGYFDKNKYIKTWDNGIKWFYEHGFSKDYFFQSYLMSKKNGKILSNLHDLKLTDDLHTIYTIKQKEMFVAMSKKLHGQEISFDELFLNSDVNIHFTCASSTNATYDQRVSFNLFHFLVNNPILWDDNMFLQNGKLMRYYLENSPKFDHIFDCLSPLSIDIKLSLFSKLQIDFTIPSAPRKRRHRLDYLTILIRNGGSEKQFMFLSNLLHPIDTSFTTFNYKVLHDMLTTRTVKSIFKSPFFVGKYLGGLSRNDSIYPFLTRNIIALLFNPLKDGLDLSAKEIDSRIETCMAYSFMYTKGLISRTTSRRIFHTNIEDVVSEKHSSYIMIIESFRYILIQLIQKWQEYSQPWSQLFLTYVNNPHWDFIMRDIMRFENNYLCTSTPSVFSIASILLMNEITLGDFWWVKNNECFWIESIGNQMNNEIQRIFGYNFLMRKTRLVPSIIEFVHKYLYPCLQQFDYPILLSWKVRAVSNPQRKDYTHLGRQITTFIDTYSNQLQTSLELSNKMDTILSEIIILIHGSMKMNDLYKGQHMFFLEELIPLDYDKTYNLFNRLINILITGNLPKSLLIFLESVEKKNDFSFINQKTNHLFKSKNGTNKIEDISINKYMSYFLLELTNEDNLIKIHNSTIDKSNYEDWCKCIYKMLWMGSLNWDNFSSKVTSLKHFHDLFSYHWQILDCYYKQKDTFYFDETKYSIAYFWQKGINPLMFTHVEPYNEKSNLTWRQKLLTSSTSCGWPMKLYFCGVNYTNVSFQKNICDKLPIYNIKINEGVKGFDYRDILSKKDEYLTRINNKHVVLDSNFVYQAQTSLAYCIMNLPRNYEEIMHLINDYENYAVVYGNLWSMRHAAIKSQLGIQNIQKITHVKLDLISLLILHLNENISAFKLKKLFNVYDQRSKLLKNILSTVEKSTPIETRVAKLSLIIKLTCNCFFVCFLFTNNIKLFDVIFQRLEYFCNVLNVPILTLFDGKILDVKAGFRLIQDSEDISMLKHFSYDILTFSIYYGKTLHVKYLMGVLERQIQKGAALPELSHRYAGSLTYVPEEHTEYYLPGANAIEHLIYSAVIKGHIKCFCHIIHHTPLKYLENINWKNIFLGCVGFIKFNVTWYSELQVIMNRKYVILKKIFNLKKLDGIKTLFRSAIIASIKYLTAYNKHITNSASYINFFKPYFMSKKKSGDLGTNFLRSELITWGDFAYKCLLLFETQTNISYLFSYEVLFNSSLLYSKELFEFVYDRINTDVPQFEDKAFYHISVSYLGKKVASDIEEYAKPSNLKTLPYIIVLILLKMEQNQIHFHISELVSSDFFMYVLQKTNVLKDCTWDNCTLKQMILLFNFPDKKLTYIGNKEVIDLINVILKKPVEAHAEYDIMDEE